MAHFLLGASGLLISTGMWVWVLRRYDRLEPEPFKVLLRVGLLGGFMSIVPAIVFNSLVDHLLGLGGFVSDLSRRISLPLALTSAVFIGINEETWKFLATLRLVRKLPEFDEPIDGMIYAMTVALGFAAIENVGYMVRFGPGVLVTRSLLSIPIHSIWPAAPYGAMVWPGPGLSASISGTLKPPFLISWPRQVFMQLLISSYFCGPGPCSWFFPSCYSLCGIQIENCIT